MSLTSRLHNRFLQLSPNRRILLSITVLILASIVLLLLVAGGRALVHRWSFSEEPSLSHIHVEMAGLAGNPFESALCEKPNFS
jgi:hypothetical protein